MIRLSWQLVSSKISMLTTLQKVEEARNVINAIILFLNHNIL